MTQRRRAVVKWFFYLMLLWIFLVLQVMVFPHFKVGGVHPAFLPILCAVVGLFEGPVGGGAYGFAAGLLLDAFIYPAEGFYALLFLMGGVAFGVTAQYALRKTLFTAMLCAAIQLTAASLLFFLIFQFITGRSHLGALLTVSVPELLYSFPFTFPIYFLCRGIYRRWGEGGR
jgi:rod shape-determining protein MreD